MVNNTMEISFIESNMASPSLVPKKDAGSLDQYMDGLQSNNGDQDIMVTDHAMSMEDDSSCGEGAVGSSETGTDLNTRLELSNGHGNRTQVISYSWLMPLKG